MKKYNEILSEIKETRAHITDTAKRDCENALDAVRAAYLNGKGEALEKARAEYHAAEEAAKEEAVRNTAAKIKIEIMINNAAQALLAETIETICEVWNKYSGKPHGPKTAEKIHAELKEKTGYHVYINNKYHDAHIQINFDYQDPAPFRSLEFFPTRNEADRPALDPNNKILPLVPDTFRVYCGGAYVDDVEAHAEAIKEAHQAAIAAEEALENAIGAYNALTRGHIQRASLREGVKRWLI